MKLEGTGRGGDPLSVQNYVDMFCTPSTQKRGSGVIIADIQDFTLQVLASTIVRLSGSSGLHMATRNQMRVAVDCFRGALYDWFSGIAPFMNRQLSDCKRGRHKNFGYVTPGEDTWLIDSCASKHMSGQKKTMSKLEEKISPQKVLLYRIIHLIT